MKKVYLNTLKPEEIIKRLKNGEIVKDDDTTRKIKMIDGIIYQLQGGDYYFMAGSGVVADNDTYFEEEENFEITETGLYRTRDGRKAFVNYIVNQVEAEERELLYVCIGVVDGDNYEYSWTGNGVEQIGETSENDLVSKWEE